jgi:hypothetical protein
MDQIVPSIIFNMEIREHNRLTITVSSENPSALAEIVFKDLFYRAPFNNISACIQPILGYDEGE